MASTGREQGWQLARPLCGNVVGDLVRQVQATIETLSVHRSELSHGDGWLDVDAALSDLHGALIALQQLDRARQDPSAEPVV